MAALERRPWHAYAAFQVLVSLIYGWAGYLPWTTPFVVNPSPLDARIPFVPAAVWPYATYLALLPGLVAATRRWPGFSRVAGTGMICALANAAVFAAVPTRLASRPEAPAGSLLAVLQAADPPACAVPSGHVGLPVSLAVAALLAAASHPRAARRWRALGRAMLAWAVVLGASALLTKQHFAVDVAAGAVFGLAVALACAAVWSRAVRASTLAAAALEWAVILAASVLALAHWSWAAALVAGAVIATRQHALLILYHDGVHGLVARDARLNDLLVNLFAGVPMLLPLHVYRALHLAHHRHLGTPQDPERTLLYRDQPWRYEPLPSGRLALQLLGDLLLWNAVRMSWRFVRDRDLRRGLPGTRWYPELAVQLALFALAWGAGAWLAPQATTRLALLWFVPYLTLTQLLNKLRSFAEHTSPAAPGDLSGTWAPGLLGRLTVWPYHINLHREHHRHPDRPWDALPECAEPRRRPGRELLMRLWRGAAP